MKRLLPVLILGTISGLPACSGSNPTTPEAAMEPAQAQTGESIVRESKSALGTPVQASGTWLDFPHRATKDALIRQTIRQGYKLEQAIWKCADDYNGYIPTDYSDLFFLINYLPGKKFLINPFTMERTEPQMRAVALSPGQVAYNIMVDSEGGVIGFVITAWGWDGMCLYLERYLPWATPGSIPVTSAASVRTF